MPTRALETRGMSACPYKTPRWDRQCTGRGPVRARAGTEAIVSGVFEIIYLRTPTLTSLLHPNRGGHAHDEATGKSEDRHGGGSDECGCAQGRQ